MGRAILAAVLLASAALACGCSSVSTDSESAAGADLSAIRTWAWMQGQDPGRLGDPADRAHVTAVVAEGGWEMCFVACAAAFLVAGVAALGVDSRIPVVPEGAKEG